ncbi:MAG: 2-hydroxyacyl-CoA dehydratase [Deltaproteobacteria bacterium]|nr:2-hydroxyacyl-CoA dehydratase [Deltaproteobacteria bacterium]
MYTDLFKMCGFSPEDLDTQRSRIEKVLARIGVTTEADIRHAEETIRRNFEVDLEGVRDLLWVYMMEFLDVVLAKEEGKVFINAGFPNPVPFLMAAKLAAEEAGKKVYIGCATQICYMMLGPVFGKINDLLETGENLGMPAGRAHCSQHQIQAALYEKGILPVPDLSLASGWFCDQAGEAEELMSMLYDYEVSYLDGVNPCAWDAYPNLDDSSIKYAAARLKRSFERVEQVADARITEEALDKALNYLGGVTMEFQTLIEVVGKADPQPISHANINLAFFLWIVPLRHMNEAYTGLKALINDAQKRIDKGIGVVPKGAPKVFVGIRWVVDNAPIKIIEDRGLSIAVMNMDTFSEAELVPSDYTDLYSLTVEGLFRRPQMSSILGSIEYWKSLPEDWDLDGILLFFQYSCRPWAIPPVMAKKGLQEALDIPVLVMEADPFDTRNYSVGQLKTRIESFAEVVKMHKVSKETTAT